MKDLNNIYTYHEPSKNQSTKYLVIRTYAKQLAEVIEDICPDSREKSLAHTNLEQATMWANASIARYKDPEPVVSPFPVPPGSVKAAPDKDPPFMHKEDKGMKITSITDVVISFEDGHCITFDHEQDCCEHNYAAFNQLDDIARSTTFQHPLQFEAVNGSGFRFGNPGKMFFVPCYSEQNGYYTDELDIYYDCEKVLSFAAEEVLY